MVEEFKLASLKMNKENNLAYIKKFIQEADNGMMVFTDASFDLDKGFSAYGVAIIDVSGNLLSCVADPWELWNPRLKLKSKQ